MAKIDDLTIEIKSNSSQAVSEIDKLANSLSNLKSAGKLTTVTNNLKKLNTAISELNVPTKTVNNLNKLSNSTVKLKNNLKGVGKIATGTKTSLMGAFNLKALNIMGIVYGVKMVSEALGNNVNSMNEYIENMNLFKVAMGEYYEEAFAYADRLQDIMGIDASEFMRSQGTFMSIAKGFGLATDMAYKMSKGLTEVSYDLSSFFNIATDEAFLKVRSGIAGELEPLRALGFALSQASLQELALEKGITKKVNAMTEGEKAQLRYVAIVEQANNMGVIGDFARTLTSPANAMRILKQQVTQLGRAIGSVLIPIITQVIPYVQAFVKVLTDGIKALATLMGFKMPEWTASDWSSNIGDSVEDTSNALGTASDNAKKLKKALMGFDELNIIPEPNNSSSGSGSSIGTGGDLGLDLASVWDEALLSSISRETDGIIEKFKTLGQNIKEAFNTQTVKDFFDVLS